MVVSCTPSLSECTKPHHFELEHQKCRKKVGLKGAGFRPTV